MSHFLPKFSILPFPFLNVNNFKEILFEKLQYLWACFHSSLFYFQFHLLMCSVHFNSLPDFDIKHLEIICGHGRCYFPPESVRFASGRQLGWGRSRCRSPTIRPWRLWAGLHPADSSSWDLLPQDSSRTPGESTESRPPWHTLDLSFSSLASHICWKLCWGATSQPPLPDRQLPEEEKQDNLRLSSLGSPVCSYLEPRSQVPHQLHSFPGSQREGLLIISSPIIARSRTLDRVSVVHLMTLLFRS